MFKVSLGPATQTNIIVDSGSTGHFFQIDARHLQKRRRTKNPLTIHLADKSTILSTHTAELPLRDLPRNARQVHLFPALKGTSLISVSQLCDAGCTATFTSQNVQVLFNEKTILSGTRCPLTNLWTVSLAPQTNTHAPAITKALEQPQLACNVTLPETASNLVAFQLLCLFSPALTTVDHALKAGILPSFPGLTEKTLRKHGSTSLATQKGHMDQSRANQESTRVPLPNREDTFDTLFPRSISPADQDHHCFATIATPTKQGNHNVSFSDQTGRFPFKSLAGYQHIFVFYHFNSNYIKLEPMKNKSQEELLRVFAKAHSLFQSAGTTFNLHILDHECPTTLKNYMRSVGVQHQLTPPGNHRRNLSERAIRTAKAHIISGLSSANPNFPMHQWEKIVASSGDHP